MNKKGFTLVELLAAIVIISVLSGIAVVAYTSFINSAKQTSFKAYESTMHAQAIKLMIESLSDPNKAQYYPRNGETIRLSLEALEIDPFNNPANKNDTCPESYVDVTRNDYNNTSTQTHVESFTYKVCLICPNSDYNATGADCKIYEN